MSKVIPKFFGKVENGKFVLYDPDAFDVFLGTISDKTEAYIEIHKRFDLRSEQQNRYYRGVVVKDFATEMNLDPEEVHEMFKYMFLSRVVKIKGIEFPFIRSTTSLNTAEMEDFLTKCRMWAAENGVYIPKPNEKYWLTVE